MASSAQHIACQKNGNISHRKWQDKSSDTGVKEIARLLCGIKLNPNPKPKVKPLGVACGKVRHYGRGGSGRKILIHIKKNKNRPTSIKKRTRWVPRQNMYSSKFVLKGKENSQSCWPDAKSDFSVIFQQNHSTQNHTQAFSERLFPPLDQARMEDESSNDPRCVNHEASVKPSVSWSPEGYINDFSDTVVSQETKSESNCSSSVNGTQDSANFTAVSLARSPAESKPSQKDSGERPPSYTQYSKDEGPVQAGGVRRRHKTQSSHKTKLEFDSYLHKRVITKIAGGRWVEGTLRGYDSFMNLVLEGTVELRRTGERVEVGLAIVRGLSIIMLELAGDMIPLEVIRSSRYYHERVPVQTIQLLD